MLQTYSIYSLLVLQWTDLWSIAFISWTIAQSTRGPHLQKAQSQALLQCLMSIRNLLEDWILQCRTAIKPLWAWLLHHSKVFLVTKAQMCHAWESGFYHLTHSGPEHVALYRKIFIFYFFNKSFLVFFNSLLLRSCPHLNRMNGDLIADEV